MFRGITADHFAEITSDGENDASREAVIVRRREGDLSCTFEAVINAWHKSALIKQEKSNNNEKKRHVRENEAK